MATVRVSGVSKGELRVECSNCDCIFDVESRDVKRRVRGADPYVLCPTCGEPVGYPYAFDFSVARK